MLFSRNSEAKGRTAGVGAVLFAVLAIVYPFLVYLGRDQVPFLVFVFAACVLLLLRAVLFPSDATAMLRLPLVITAVAIGALGLVDTAIATKAYPAVLSGLVAAVFANSLHRPPSLIERFARLKKPQLPPEGRLYCRKVTWVWTLWLSANALIAAALAVWGSIGLWALWTGVISYIVMGALFAGEIVLRQWILRHAALGRNE